LYVWKVTYLAIFIIFLEYIKIWDYNIYVLEV
jgi:hypothetical protein